MNLNLVDRIYRDVVFVKTKYTDESVAVIAITDDGEKLTNISVNMNTPPSIPNAIYIKDYSENEGLVIQLEEAGLVTPTGLTMSSGWVEVAEYEMTPKFLALCQDRS